ncbi:MAG: adenylyltransferase/cytidyltransferase family protein [Candidatus Micrarchaeota archaeon]|nr:adenylyltransferase/cytidyltransferase family protein [Candidatus Micrarchaeota archaeon]
MKTVLVAGAFDFMHPGHLALFDQAREHGERVVVVVGRDATIERVKGRKPVFDENQRLAVVSRVRGVDGARLGNEGSFLDVLLEEKPDVVVLGYDQGVSEETVLSFARQNGLALLVVRAKAFSPEQFKSSRLKAALGI